MPPPGDLSITDMEHKNRKYPRLKEYNYSLPGYYYVTIHNERNGRLLSRVVPGSAHRRAEIQLTQIGEIVMEQLLLLEQRYPYVKIDKYVIMPTHIHVMIRLLDGVLPRPGLTDIVGAYKSLATRSINMAQNTPGERQFQRSFYEAVIRNEAACQSCWKYIDGNPDQWGLRKEKEWEFHYVDESIRENPQQPKRGNTAVGASPHPTDAGGGRKNDTRKTH